MLPQNVDPLYVLPLVLLTSEVVFYMYIKFFVAPSLQRAPDDAPYEFKKPVDMFRNIYDLCDSLESYALDKFFCGFMSFCDFEEICYENVHRFIAWAVFVKPFVDLQDSEKSIVYKLRQEAAKRMKKDFQQGDNPAVRESGIHFDAVSYIHHPLCLVAFLYLLDMITLYGFLYPLGFKKYSTSNGLTYWYNGYQDQVGSQRAPVVLFHGICTGWLYYSLLIRKLVNDRPVFLFDNRNVKIGGVPSSRSPHPGPLEVNASFKEMLSTHDVASVSIVAHSWGTTLAGWVVRLSPSMASNLTLIDPASVTMVFPEATHELLYKQPRTLADYLLNYFVRYDLNLSWTLRRHFYWYNGFLELHEVPKDIGIIVGIAADDELVNSAVAYEISGNASDKRKQREAITRIVWKNCMHGQAISRESCVMDIIMALKESDGNVKENNVKSY